MKAILDGAEYAVWVVDGPAFSGFASPEEARAWAREHYPDHRAYDVRPLIPHEQAPAYEIRGTPRHAGP